MVLPKCNLEYITSQLELFKSFFYFLILTTSMTWMVWFPPVPNTISRPLSSAQRDSHAVFSLFLDVPHSFPHQGLCSRCFLHLEHSFPTLRMVSSSSPFGSQLECPLLWETIPNLPAQRRSLPYYSLSQPPAHSPYNLYHNSHSCSLFSVYSFVSLLACVGICLFG